MAGVCVCAPGDVRVQHRLPYPITLQLLNWKRTLKNEDSGHLQGKNPLYRPHLFQLLLSGCLGLVTVL